MQVLQSWIVLHNVVFKQMLNCSDTWFSFMICKW